MKKLFLELDSELNEGMMLQKYRWDLILNCSDYPAKTWEAVLTHDQIHFDSTLLSNESSLLSSDALFNIFMERALMENIPHKEVFIWNAFEDIKWSKLNKEWFGKCFLNGKHSIYTKDEHGNYIEVSKEQIESICAN